MNQEIYDIFAEYEDLSAAELTTLTSIDNSDINITNRPLDSECARILSLSDVFLEWFLHDSNTPGNLRTFLETEELTDIFTEQQFMDLMCGTAYLDNDLIKFIALKLPFPLSSGRLAILNGQSQNAYLVKSPKDIIAKTKELIKQKTSEIKARKLAQKKIYYATNKERIAEKGKIYRETHKEEIKARKKKYWHTHKEEIAERRKQHYEAHKDEMREQKRKWAHEHPEYYKKRAKKESRIKYMQEYHKKYVAKNREAVQEQKKAWYEANKQEILAQQREIYAARKQQAESAKQICAAYAFLLALRKNNNKEYKTIYPGQQNPLLRMLKICPALQNMDISLCPFCNENCGTEPEQCCNQKVLAMPNAIDRLQEIANDLKQR